MIERVHVADDRAPIAPALLRHAHRKIRALELRGIEIDEVDVVHAIACHVVGGDVAGEVTLRRGEFDEVAVEVGQREDRGGRDAGFEFLETRVAEAMPLFEPTKSGLVGIVFSGTSVSLRFVAPSQNGPSGGGLYRYTFELRPQSSGGLSSLVVVVAP